MKIAITAIAAIAGAAVASPTFTSVDAQNAGSYDTAGAFATITIDVSGYDTHSTFNSGLNTVLQELIGAGAHITGFGYDVTVTAHDPSWNSEARIAIFNTGITGGVLFTLGGLGEPGTEALSSGGILDLATVNPSAPLDFFLDADGLVNIEFYESFDDGAVDPDATFDSGTIQIQYEVPAPGALAMLGLGGLVAGRRRR